MEGWNGDLLGSGRDEFVGYLERFLDSEPLAEDQKAWRQNQLAASFLLKMQAEISTISENSAFCHS